MPAILLEGRPIAEKIKAALATEVAALKAKYSRTPKLVAVQIGEDPSSSVYIKNQKKTAESLGIEYELKVLDAAIAQSGADAAIRALNQDEGVTAVILQLPVPKGIDPKKLVNLISPDKDAEGMHPQNAGKILLGSYTIGPCTAMAVMELLESIGTNLYGKEACVVGHSEIVGKPIALMLLNKFVTTTVCHIATGQRGLLADHIKAAEIVVVAVGKAALVKGDWIKDGAIVIDVGINRVGDKIVGDVEFEKASQRAGYITPVPGGVGPLTVTMLMRNLIEAFKIQHDRREMRLAGG